MRLLRAHALLRAHEPRKPAVSSMGIAAALAAIALAAGAGFAWHATRAADQCSVLPTEVSSAEPALATFISKCTQQPLAAEAQRRLDAIMTAREAQQAREAGHDVAKLKTYLSNCRGCADRDELRVRLSLVTQDEERFRGAGRNVARLKAYLAQCVVCQHKPQVEQAIAALGAPKRALADYVGRTIRIRYDEVEGPQGAPAGRRVHRDITIQVKSERQIISKVRVAGRSQATEAQRPLGGSSKSLEWRLEDGQLVARAKGAGFIRDTAIALSGGGCLVAIEYRASARKPVSRRADAIVCEMASGRVAQAS